MDHGASTIDASREAPQATFTERIEELQRRASERDPRGPARAIFAIVLALLSFGFMLQASHAATTVPRALLGAELRELAAFRLAGVGILLGAWWLGPRRLAPFVPALTVMVMFALVAVYLPFIGAPRNGSHRWILIPGLRFGLQPSEFARVLLVLWVARRCALLGPRIGEWRAGFAPTAALGLAAFALVFLEPDLGGSILLLLCYGATLFVGGARMNHVALAGSSLGGAALLFGLSQFSHIRERIAVWTGEATNDQVRRSAEAMASGDWFGVGLGQGLFRNASLQYMQTDYALALVGEEFGLFGVLLVVGLFAAFTWHALRLVLAVEDRFAALTAFGLTVSVAFQAMLHLQVVTGLAPPKGMALPFLSDGGSSLLASCLAVGLALGAARKPPPRRRA
ncbi:MAG: FtsW/RodA/SpoVE family cell cycle protein [Planctomycetota bacterium]